MFFFVFCIFAFVFQKVIKWVVWSLHLCGSKMVKYWHFHMVQPNPNISTFQVFTNFAWSSLINSSSSFSHKFSDWEKNLKMNFFFWVSGDNHSHWIFPCKWISCCVFYPSILKHILTYFFLPKNSWCNCMVNSHSKSKISIFHVIYWEH